MAKEVYDVNYIKNLLKKYNDNKSIIALRKIEIQKIEKQLEYNNSENIITEAEAIQEICLSAPGISDMPKSITNKFSSVTENAVLHYQSIINTQNIFDVIELKTRKRILELENEPLQDEIDIIDSLLNNMEIKKRFIIYKHFIQGYKFVEVENLYIREFGVQSIHQKTVYNQYQSALSNLLNRYIISKR